MNLINYYNLQSHSITSYSINFGPQHPSAHGVLRLILDLVGEVVTLADPHIGLLHRGTEKLIEAKTVLQAMPYFDRLDYVSTMAQEHAFVLSVEQLGGVTVPARARYIRVIYSEITRILNHLMSVTTHALDIGALTPFLWAFEEREKLMEFYERVSGARLHAAYFRVGGVSQDLPQGLLHDIFLFCTQFASRLDEIEELLTSNRIWKQRLVNIGVVSAKQAKNAGFTGVLLRGSGGLVDIRQASPYENYASFNNWRLNIGTTGDCYDRYLIRMQEMRQSIQIIHEAINSITEGPVNTFSKIFKPLRAVARRTMEGTIQHFKFFSSGSVFNRGATYAGIEAPKGEFGVTAWFAAHTNTKMTRCKVRAPGFYHLSALDLLARNLLVSDVVAIIGTQDIVFGEVDR